jgi:hypothetical protein
MDLLAAMLLAMAVTGCGGGGSSQSSNEGMALVSITFPEKTDLSGATTSPPFMAPLSQQVVFTFSGEVQGDVSSNAIRIYADPGEEYKGPVFALDATKNLIPARGTFEKLSNVVVFTPYIPIKEINLDPNAQPEQIPGLLPGYSYNIFVPVGTTGSIQNLTGIATQVIHPVAFITIPPDLPSLFFVNHPALPPEVVSTNPALGTEEFSVKPFSHGKPPHHEDIILTFDQPLDFTSHNLEGWDQNGNGVSDQNLFLEYTGPQLLMAMDKKGAQEGYIARLNRTTNAFELVGYTQHETVNVGLKSVVLTQTHEMIGCDGTRLFDVAYEEGLGNPPVCALTNERTLSEGQAWYGLVFTRDNELFALDAGDGGLALIDPDTGEVEKQGVLDPGFGDLMDLAVGRDNALYGLRVYGPGTPHALGSVERIDRSTLKITPVVSGLQGDYSCMIFSRDGHVLLFEANELQWMELDLATGLFAEHGLPVKDPLLPKGSRPDMSVKHYELGVIPVLLDNSYHGAKVRIDPSGVLPFLTWIDIMARFSLENLSGGSKTMLEGRDPLGAESVCRFKTFDPGEGPIDGFFLEEFLDNEYEATPFELSGARAVWNVQDKDQTHPEYKHMLAGLGLSGSGELGDFVPHPAITQMIMLDTDYQPLPLYDGSTPNILEPIQVKGGEFHFRDIVIPEGVTVMARGSNPLVFTATGRVEIAGTVDVSGLTGGNDVSFDSAFFPVPGGAGGPGGGRGGMAQQPIPKNFSSLTQLQSVPRGERGWGPRNLYQIGGQGGESGAKGPDVPWNYYKDPDSRGAGGGGGTYVLEGFDGYPGRGKYGVDEMGEFYIRDAWYYWDGSWEYDGTGNWKPGDPYTPRINEFFIEDEHRNPLPGEPGEKVFKDGDPDNNFIGYFGELKEIQGGQGGGGGGARLDSMNPWAAKLAEQRTPKRAPSAFDAKGGGGGGGGGAVAIHCLGEIVIRSSGSILAKGGMGGAGELTGCANHGGGGGGGSGGTIILNSGTRIYIEHFGDHYGTLDVSGGWGGDASLKQGYNWGHLDNPCKIYEQTGNLKYITRFCSWSVGEGGFGGYGLIQLMVPDPSDMDQLDFMEDSTRAMLRLIQYEPNYKKTLGKDEHFSYYHFEVEGLGPGGTKPFIQHMPYTSDCLVPPEKTLSTIGPQNYAVSKWIDLGRLVERPAISGKAMPLFKDFEGINIVGDWGVVATQNGHVVNGHLLDFNDIEVDAPDLDLADYIPDTNEVAFQFQGTDALIPGSKVPNEAPDVVTPWKADLASLSGKQFVRFRVKFNVAKGTTLSPYCHKPQLNRVRLRFGY